MFGTKIKIDENKIAELLERRLENIYPSREEVEERLKSGDRIRVYLGIDPTGPDLHLGHTIPILFLKQLLELNHKPVLVIGDFTAKIGDPTGKETARKQLTDKEVKENMKNYLGQVYKILPKGSFEVKYNSSWLSKMSFEDVVKLASHVTVQQMIVREMFQERIKNEKPIGVHEFLYPLMQGYDSVAMGIDGEVGGNDQTFNMLVGRDMEKKLLNKDKLVFATRLLVDAESGKKMSKTEGGLISLSDSPQDIYGKTMKTVPDQMIATVFELCTEKDWVWIKENKENIKNEPLKFKKELAFELVRMYHGEKIAHEAINEWEKVFSKKEMPSEIQEAPGEGIKLVDFMTEHSLATSSSDAKRLLDQGAVSINEEVVKEWGYILKGGDVVRVGSRKFLKVV